MRSQKQSREDYKNCQHEFILDKKKPMFIQCADGLNGSEVNFVTKELDISISIGLENVKKLYIILREYLKKDGVTPTFHQNDMFVLTEDHNVISERPAKELLQELSV